MGNKKHLTLSCALSTLAPHDIYISIRDGKSECMCVVCVCVCVRVRRVCGVRGCVCGGCRGCCVWCVCVCMCVCVYVCVCVVCVCVCICVCVCVCMCVWCVCA